METQRSERAEIIRRYYELLWNEGRVDLVDELLSPDYVNHSPGSPDQDTGRAGVRGVVLAMRAAFPDLRYAIEDIVAADDAVAVRTTMTGTHRGDFFRLAPTGRTFRVSQICIERFAGRQIAAHHRVTDQLALLRQLGVVA
jgi:steroid delta-isomerase-like uncharacterized protein